MQLLGNFTAVDELLHLSMVFLPHVLGVSRVLSFQENGEQLKHRFFNCQRWVLQSVFTNFAQGTC